MKILTNMRFHESPAWRAAATSIYPDHGATIPAPWPAWREAWRLWWGAPRFEAVVTMGTRESLLYGLLCLFTGRSSKQVLCELFLDVERPHSIVWRLKERAFRALSARALGLLTNSRHEQRTQAARLGIPASRAIFVPLNANPVPRDPPATDERFIVAAGRSWRDYPTLLKALEGTEIKAHLFVGSDDLPGAASRPGLIIHREAERQVYLDHLRRCTFAVVPLLPTDRATGQVVLLEAMASGKAVIATQAPGTTDYLDEGRTGYFVPPGDAQKLREVIEALWRDLERCARVGAAALEEATGSFSVSAHTAAKLRAISLLHAAGAAG